jgi:hypothetical protein
MLGGKLDEELSRMSKVVAGISPGCTRLCNEPFSSTNEREGSDIGRQVDPALGCRRRQLSLWSRTSTTRLTASAKKKCRPPFPPCTPPATNRAFQARGGEPGANRPLRRRRLPTCFRAHSRGGHGYAPSKNQHLSPCPGHRANGSIREEVDVVTEEISHLHCESCRVDE